MSTTRLAVATVGAIAIALAMLALRPVTNVGPPPSPTPTAGAATIVGTWDVTLTPQDLLDAGVIGHIATDPDDSGHFRLTFTTDQWQVSHLSPLAWSTSPAGYSVDPGIVHLGSPGDTMFQTPYEVTATTLTFGPQAPTWLFVKPWTRVATEPLASSIPRTPHLGSGQVGTTLEPGTYRVVGFAAPFTVTLPAAWKAADITPNGVGLESAADGKISIAFIVMNKTYADPCHPRGGPQEFGSGVDDLVAAFSAMPGFRVAELRDATVGAARGKAFTFTNTNSAGDCAENPMPLGTTLKNSEAADVPMFAGETDHFWVLDAGGTTILIAITSTPQIDAATQPVFDSLAFLDDSSN